MAASVSRAETVNLEFSWVGPESEDCVLVKVFWKTIHDMRTHCENQRAMPILEGQFPDAVRKLRCMVPEGQRITLQINHEGGEASSQGFEFFVGKDYLIEIGESSVNTIEVFPTVEDFLEEIKTENGFTKFSTEEGEYFLAMADEIQRPLVEAWLRYRRYTENISDIIDQMQNNHVEKAILMIDQIQEVDLKNFAYLYLAQYLIENQIGLNFAESALKKVPDAVDGKQELVGTYIQVQKDLEAKIQIADLVQMLIEQMGDSIEGCKLFRKKCLSTLSLKDFERLIREYQINGNKDDFFEPWVYEMLSKLHENKILIAQVEEVENLLRYQKMPEAIEKADLLSGESQLFAYCLITIHYLVKGNKAAGLEMLKRIPTTHPFTDYIQRSYVNPEPKKEFIWHPQVLADLFV